MVKVVLYFYAYIKHDIIQATDLQEKYKENLKVPMVIDAHQSLQHIKLTQEVAHLQIDFGQQVARITSHSLNAHKFFGYAPEEFALRDKVSYLLPPPFSEVHDQLIVQFIRQQESECYCTF